MNKNITIIIALAAVCGCQKTEKTIYRVPLSEHAMELERQERAYNDSLEKYSALLDTTQVRYYFDLHKAVLDTLGVVMQQEAEAFMAAKDREAANEENSSMTTELILLGVAIILLIATIIYVSITTIFWTRIGWFFEDVWHWFKETASISPGPCFGKEDLSDEEIHEIMNIIHHGNPPKYKIVRGEDIGKEDLEQEYNNNPIKHQKQ